MVVRIIFISIIALFIFNCDISAQKEEIFSKTIEILISNDEFNSRIDIRNLDTIYFKRTVAINNILDDILYIQRNLVQYGTYYINTNNNHIAIFFDEMAISAKRNFINEVYFHLSRYKIFKNRIKLKAFTSSLNKIENYTYFKIKARFNIIDDKINLKYIKIYP